MGPRGGLGLGLALVKRLVDLHGGTITATSAGLGQGSAFLVRLPLEGPPEAEAPRPAPRRPAPVSSPRPLRVAVVEDNRDIRETLTELLTILGHDVSSAPDGPQGLALIVDREPDVALVDLGLPGLDGYEVARRARAALNGARCRLVAMTGFGHESDRRRALEAGFDRHLVKPADVEAIEEVLTLDPES